MNRGRPKGSKLPVGMLRDYRWVKAHPNTETDDDYRKKVQEKYHKDTDAFEATLIKLEAEHRNKKASLKQAEVAQVWDGVGECPFCKRGPNHKPAVNPASETSLDWLKRTGALGGGSAKAGDRPQ